MEINQQAMEQIRKLSQDPAAQQLIRMLQRSGGTGLQAAMDSAARGDYAQAQKALSSLLEDPEAQKLLKQLGR